MAARIGFVDVAKGIGIVAIVLGHTSVAGPDGINWISQLVFQFHVPIFFVISGYFLSPSKPLGPFVRSRAWRLIAPYAFTCAVMAAIMLVFRVVQGFTHPPAHYATFAELAVAALYGAGSYNVILPEGVTPIGAIWFLEALLIALVEVRLALHAKRFAPVVVVGLFAAAYVSSSWLWLPLNIQSGLMGGLYVYVGHLCATRSLFERRFSGWWLAVLTVVVAASCVADVYVSIVRAHFGPYFIGLFESFLACAWCLLLARAIDDHVKPLASLFDFLGSNSLVVLCVHLVLLNMGFIRLLRLVTGDALAPDVLFVVNATLQIAIAVACVLLFRKIPGVRKVFF